MRKFILFFSFISILILANCRDKSIKEAAIQPGAERINEYLQLLDGKRVGLVVNQSSLVGTSHLLDTLLRHGVDVCAIYTPEHGYSGIADPGELIGDEKERNSGIRIVSLYSSKKKPSVQDLAGIEIMIFDIQDVGVRFYTYISTLHYVLEACAENNIPLILLDRPNPLGFYIDGPILDRNYSSFLGLHPIPLVHGLTTGELAAMINGEGWLKDKARCNLKIITCAGYTHNSFYELPVNPSPNLRNMKAVYLYPTIGLFIGTKMSIGHGTDIPYLVVGHPGFPDKTYSFVPQPNLGAKDPKFKGKTCYGISLAEVSVDSLKAVRKIEVGFVIKIYEKMKKSSDFFNSSFNYHAGNGELMKQIESGMTEEEIRATWQKENEKYKKIRKRYLLYPDFE
ncbi:MAG: DUF1343 domain-containing protein [Bacteroidales bacterium]|nr:DUF1343 domain-containing protein [Bacteroidales bacterium]